MKCPICKKTVEAPTYRPFCSRHCADVDLERWLGDGYSLPDVPMTNLLLEQAEHQARQKRAAPRGSCAPPRGPLPGE
ncbi:DNA gyrase inhibitor YacG [Formicincola oecophyllae]|uniref:DNA gyrase inhibitor YacG n=1 Tax=Formicincola oecophyllae TaxID=2558361 RepID=A0A4Y6U7Y6_9PROT|nr:DNA gyrase inhibitor YacG [Formicincola oecophyllae]QDH13539.1 DNA gyrase inhibitor YacG [Formicincola oecophyllae]